MAAILTAVLLDTDVVIDFLRGHGRAIAYFQNLQIPPSLSCCSVAELYAGVRDGPERLHLDAFMRGLTILPITHQIAEQGGLFRRDYGKTHGVGLIDALIAATANVHGLPLVTFNVRHYPQLKKVSAPYARP